LWSGPALGASGWAGARRREAGDEVFEFGERLPEQDNFIIRARAGRAAAGPVKCGWIRRGFCWPTGRPRAGGSGILCNLATPGRLVARRGPESRQTRIVRIAVGDFEKTKQIEAVAASLIEPGSAARRSGMRAEQKLRLSI